MATRVHHCHHLPTQALAGTEPVPVLLARGTGRPRARSSRQHTDLPPSTAHMASVLLHPQLELPCSPPSTRSRCQGCLLLPSVSTVILFLPCSCSWHPGVPDIRLPSPLLPPSTNLALGPHLSVCPCYLLPGLC